MGVDVGHRWEELADKAEARIGEAGHPLLVPHLMMALEAPAGCRGRPFPGRAARACRRPRPVVRWRDRRGECCRCARRRGRTGAAITPRVVDLLAPRAKQIWLLGGSNAQRDLFMQMLIDAAMKAGRRDLVAEMIAHETATRAVPPTQRAGYAAAARWIG